MQRAQSRSRKRRRTAGAPSTRPISAGRKEREGRRERSAEPLARSPFEIIKEAVPLCFAEADYENAVLELFRDTLGYGYVYGPDVERDYSDPLYRDDLLPALRQINPNLPKAALDEAGTH